MAGERQEAKMTPRFLTSATGWIPRLETLTEEQLAGGADTLFGDITEFQL